MSVAPTLEQIKKRFWSKVDIRGPDECWEWQAGRDGDNEYGIFWMDQRNWGAHVASFVLNGGTLISGMNICHKCDNPPCVNPDHLFQGTPLDNRRDMLEKGRENRARLVRENYKRGEEQHLAKLDWDTVREIRATYRRRVWGFGMKALADKYGVSKPTIRRILRHDTWKEEN